MTTIQYMSAIVALLLRIHRMDANSIYSNMLQSAQNAQAQIQEYGRIVTSTAPITDRSTPLPTDVSQ